AGPGASSPPRDGSRRGPLAACPPVGQSPTVALAGKPPVTPGARRTKHPVSGRVKRGSYLATAGRSRAGPFDSCQRETILPSFRSGRGARVGWRGGGVAAKSWEINTLAVRHRWRTRSPTGGLAPRLRT